MAAFKKAASIPKVASKKKPLKRKSPSKKSVPKKTPTKKKSSRKTSTKKVSSKKTPAKKKSPKKVAKSKPKPKQKPKKAAAASGGPKGVDRTKNYTTHEHLIVKGELVVGGNHDIKKMTVHPTANITFDSLLNLRQQGGSE